MGGVGMKVSGEALGKSEACVPFVLDWAPALGVCPGSLLYSPSGCPK